MDNQRFKLTRAEKETIIRIAEDETEWDIWTASQPIMNRLDKYFSATETREQGGHVWCKEYKIPRRCVSFRSPKKRVITEKQKKNAKLALVRYRQNQK